jgi:hypothetical protein
MSIFKSNRGELRLDVSRYVVDGIGLHRGTNYKKKIPLMQLVDLKITDFNERFIQYVGMADKIRDSLEGEYPYLNLEHFDLQWSAHELIEECLRQHLNFEHHASRMPKQENIVPERLRDAENIHS